MARKHPLELGCTEDRHKQLGITAVINARAGQQRLNDQTIEDVELMRDAIKIRQHASDRIAIHQFNSKFCRRNKNRLAHLISNTND